MTAALPKLSVPLAPTIHRLLFSASSRLWRTLSERSPPIMSSWEWEWEWEWERGREMVGISAPPVGRQSRTAPSPVVSPHASRTCHGHCSSPNVVSLRISWKDCDGRNASRVPAPYVRSGPLFSVQRRESGPYFDPRIVLDQGACPGKRSRPAFPLSSTVPLCAF